MPDTAGRMPAIPQITCLRPSTPAGPGNSRKKDTQYVTRRCCRTADTCSAAARASGLPPCASASASSRFCVSELP
jgi:hypothetical protein